MVMWVDVVLVLLLEVGGGDDWLLMRVPYYGGSVGSPEVSLSVSIGVHLAE